MRDTEWEITQTHNRDDREAAHRRNQGEEYRPSRLNDTSMYARVCPECGHITRRAEYAPRACEKCGKAGNPKPGRP